MTRPNPLTAPAPCRQLSPALALALLLALLLALPCPAPAVAETAPPAEAQTMPRPVVSEIVSADTLRQRSFTGVIEAESRASLAFQTAGRLAEMTLAVGDVVKAGQVLATLDQVSLQEDVDAASAAVTSTRATALAAAQNLARVRELNARAVASDEQLGAAQRANDTAAAQAEAAAADLKRAADAAGFGTLTAPQDGVVLSIAAEAGTVVGAGSPVLTLALGPGREAVLDLPSDYLPLLTPGRSFILHGRVPGAAPLTGTLRLIEPVAGTGTRSRRIRVSLDDPGSTWRIGALVTASLAGAEAEVITLPATAITGTPEAPQVWTITGAPRAAHLVPVTLGAPLGARIIIAGGLSPGDEVATRGVHSLTEGQLVGDRAE